MSGLIGFARRVSTTLTRMPASTTPYYRNVIATSSTTTPTAERLFTTLTRPQMAPAAEDATSKTKTDRTPTYSSFEFVPHFTDKYEPPMAEVEAEFKRGYDDKVIMDLKRRPIKNRSVPKLTNLKVRNEDPASVYPIARGLPEKKTRRDSEYDHQYRLYKKQVSALRRKWSLQHIMDLETRQNLSNLKAQRERQRVEALRAVDPLALEKRRQRKKEKQERHRANMKRRKEAADLKAERTYEEWQEQQLQVKAVRQEAISALTRMSQEWFTPKTLDRRVRLLLSTDTDFDKDIEVPKRKNFNPYKEKNERLLFHKISRS